MFYISLIFISILGTISHFIYEWSNHNKIIGIFFAVNESTWEHIKILLTPTFIWNIIEIPFLYTYSNFIFASFIRLLVVIILMPLLFYGYKIITKKSYLFIDILIFYIDVIVSNIIFNKLLYINPVPGIINYISFIIIILIFISYLLLTLIPIKNFIFRDPINKKYGFIAHDN